MHDFTDDVADFVRSQIVDLVVVSITKLLIFIGWALSYYIFGRALAWPIRRVLLEIAHNGPRALINIPTANRVAFASTVVFTSVGVYRGLLAIEVELTLLLYGGSLVFLCLSWIIQQPLANYCSGWSNTRLVEGMSICFVNSKIEGVIQHVGSMHTILQGRDGLISVPNSRFQSDIYCIRSSNKLD